MKFRALVHTCTSHQRHLKVLQACPSPSSQEPACPVGLRGWGWGSRNGEEALGPQAETLPGRAWVRIPAGPSVAAISPPTRWGRAGS